MEGGFWGIKTDDGRDLLPVPSLPAQFQKEGLRIKAEAQNVNAFTIFMWGKTVKLSNINTE